MLSVRLVLQQHLNHITTFFVNITLPGICLSNNYYDLNYSLIIIPLLLCMFLAFQVPSHTFVTSIGIMVLNNLCSLLNLTFISTNSFC